MYDPHESEMISNLYKHTRRKFPCDTSTSLICVKQALVPHVHQNNQQRILLSSSELSFFLSERRKVHQLFKEESVWCKTSILVNQEIYE